LQGHCNLLYKANRIRHYSDFCSLTTEFAQRHNVSILEFLTALRCKISLGGGGGGGKLQVVVNGAARISNISQFMLTISISETEIEVLSVAANGCWTSNTSQMTPKYISEINGTSVQPMGVGPQTSPSDT
jgi:hypothetical protein